MSATVETSTASWRKRHREEDQIPQMDRKRPRNYYYRLESESSKASEEDTESVYSLQDRETDVCRDTTDTDTDSKADMSDQDEYELFEYEVASLSGSDNGSQGNSSSGSEDHMFLAAAVEAIYDSSLETWITDCEESDNSSLDDSFVTRSGFSRCVQCKSENDNPLYRYCEKCFQDRKKFFPPRPKGNKTRKATTKKSPTEPPVKLDILRSCLSGLSQDSGIGSSQECPPLDLDQIIVPDEHLRPDTSDKPAPTQAETDPAPSNSTEPPARTTTSKRKRDLSESSLSDYEIVKKSKPQRPKTLALSQTSDLGSEMSASSFSSTATEKSSADSSELCIFCNSAPKDSIFLHTNVAHQCCCYRCAKRTLNTIKRCPICNRSVNKMSCTVPAAPAPPALKDLPKVTGDFKSELEGFKSSNLKNADTVEKVVLPSAEDVAQERTRNALMDGVENFQTSSLKRTDTKEKIILPNAQDVAAEKTEKALIEGIERFDTSKLKHTLTQEKNPLPDKEVVQQEKTHQTLLNGVEHFDKTTMKHAETTEKVVLPDQQVIEQEKGQRKLISGIENFDNTKLKHAETQEKNPLPTKETIDQEKSA